MVVSNITFRKESLMELAVFPKGTKALLVNLSVNMAIETISDLNRFGITNIEFYPLLSRNEEIPGYRPCNHARGKEICSRKGLIG
mgnify:CR=1 FL=1